MAVDSNDSNVMDRATGFVAIQEVLLARMVFGRGAMG